MNEPSSAPPPADQNLAGRVLGDYLLLRRLGRGGMAEVYLAEQQSLQRQVAIKILRPDLAAEESYVRRFHNEARSAAALVHANIVQIYEVGCVDGLHFIAQEYVRGQNLKQVVSRSGPLAIPQVVSIVRQVSAALHKAGQEKIIHRDIKPENILLMPNGEAKVADFGLARVIDQSKMDMTQAGITMGTPLYMSPEQVEGGTLDPRSDLYSCGATAYYMLVGQPPFEGETALNVAVQHLQNQPDPVRQRRPDAPHELCDIVSKLLAKKPSDRYRTAGELLWALRALKIDEAEYNIAFEIPFESDSLDTQESTALDATRQLQTLMETQAMMRIAPERKWLWLVAVAVASVLGVGAASVVSPGSILALDESDVPQVERRSTAEAQFMYAVFANNEEAWLSVADLHPPDENPVNRYWGLRAQHQLAMHYLNNGDARKAFEVFGRLAEDSEPEFRAIGLAGQAIIHDLRDETAPHQLAAKLSAVWNDRRKLDANGLRRDLEAIVRKRGIQLPEGPRPE